MTRLIVFIASHLAAVALGFALGVYFLPILTAPDAPPTAEVESHMLAARYKARFQRDLPGSDLLHWGEGEVAVGPDAVALMGRLAPGPDYKLYLVPEYVDTRDAFLRVKESSLRVGDVRTFENFVVLLPAAVDLGRYTTVLVWCEAFSQFITAARYRQP